jgi:hypothetical protein
MEARVHPVGLRSISQRLKSSDSNKKRAQSRGPTFSLFLTEDNLTPLWRAHSSVAAFPVVLHPFGNLRHNVMKGIISSTAAVADFCMISCRKQEEILSFNSSYVLVSRTYVRAANCNQTLPSVNSVADIIAMTSASDMTTIRS